MSFLNFIWLFGAFPFGYLAHLDIVSAYPIFFYAIIFPLFFCRFRNNLYFCSRGCTTNKNIMAMSNETMTRKIAEYFKTQPVLKAWIFGSYARGEQTKDSDVDILFEPDMSQRFSLLTLGGMYMDLKELLGREVDLVPEGSLLPFALESANHDKVLIYERAR